MAPENRISFRRLRDGIVDWLTHNELLHLVPDTLPPALYADASHPLTEGYQSLAGQLYGNTAFRKWLGIDAGDAARPSRP
jgi:hypothetical protein